MFGEAGKEGVDVGARAEFAQGAEEFGGEGRFEGLELETALLVCVKETEIVVIGGFWHTAGAAVVERELAESSIRFLGFHRESKARSSEWRAFDLVFEGE